MIRSKDLNLEIKTLELKAEKSASSVGLADVLKCICLLLKVIRDIKTNQVTIMRNSGVKLIEPRTSENTDRNTTDAKGQRKSDTTDRRK